MTRKEEIKQNARKYAEPLADSLHFGDSPITRARIHAFIKGAEYADQNSRKGLWDNEKVISFIKENVREYHKSGVFHVDDFIQDLRKAMED